MGQQEDFIIRQLSKIDEIYEKLGALTSEIKEVKTLAKRIEEQGECLNKLADRVTRTEMDITALTQQVNDLKDQIDSTDNTVEIIKESKSSTIIKILWGACTAMAGAIGTYFLSKLGMI